MSREQLVAALPALRGLGPDPTFAGRAGLARADAAT